MRPPPNAEKAALREQIRAVLTSRSPAARAAASAQACAQMKESRLWAEARTILFFAPRPDELDVWPLLLSALGEGKTVALPRFTTRAQTYVAARLQNPETELRRGHF